MTTPTAVNAQTIDLAFRLAGFQYGTPEQADRQEYQPPDDYDVIIRLFDSATILSISNRLDRDVALVYNLAASFLDFVTNAGYTVTGRQIELESYTIGDITFSYPIAAVYRRNMHRNANTLRAMGRRRLNESTEQAVTPSPSNPSDTTGVTASEVEFAVTQHASLDNAHHDIPDISNFVTNADIRDLQTESQVDSLIAQHASQADSHHSPPDISSFLTESAIQTLVNNALATGSGLNSAQVNALIAIHANLPNVHHTPPIVGSGQGGGLSALEVDQKIADHAELTNIHHTQPILTDYALATAVDAVNTRVTNAINQIGTDIDTHANLPNVHHTPPTGSSNPPNPKMVKVFTATDNYLWAYNVASPLIIASSFPTISANTTTQPRFFRITLNGGRFINRGYYDNSEWYGHVVYLNCPSSSGSQAAMARRYRHPGSWEIFNAAVTNVDDYPSQTQQPISIDILVQQNVGEGTMSFAVDIYTHTVTAEDPTTRNSTTLYDWNIYTGFSVTPLAVNPAYPLVFTVERLDNLATSL